MIEKVNIDEKKAAEFTRTMIEGLNELDLSEQNLVIKTVAQSILDQRKEYLNRSAEERERFGELTDQFLKNLQSIS